MNKGPNCWQCQHFGISYDVKLPYMCRLMGFKTKLLPAIEVLRADGQYCQGFFAKVAQPLKTATSQNNGQVDHDV